MRVGFHYGRRYPAARRGVDHWPRHVPASSEHDVGLASAEDASARRRRSTREEERARELERGSPRKSGNGEAHLLNELNPRTPRFALGSMISEGPNWVGRSYAWMIRALGELKRTTA